MASAAFDIELESFITTLYTCEAAVYLDTSPSRKETLQKYLISALVPISTICNALRFVDSKELETHGESIKEICQKLLENMQFKIEYLKNMNKNEYVIKILHQVVVKKINLKLKQYVSVSDFHGVLDDELQFVHVLCLHHNKCHINLYFFIVSIFCKCPFPLILISKNNHTSRK